MVLTSLAALAFAAGSSEDRLDAVPLPATCRQAVYVESPNWTSTEATLGRYRRTDRGWRRVGNLAPVRLGRSGLAWGDGIFAFVAAPGEPQKREGDGCAPAGVFELPHAFGRETQPPKGTRMAYRYAGERDYWVDDVASPDYNTWQHLDGEPNNPKTRWRSTERMITKGLYYNLGIVVAHNMAPIQPGHGSAIFLHLWENPTETTAGCTAMSPATMRELLGWLRPDQHPLLVQLPIDRTAPKPDRPGSLN